MLDYLIARFTPEGRKGNYIFQDPYVSGKLYGLVASFVGGVKGVGSVVLKTREGNFEAVSGEELFEARMNVETLSDMEDVFETKDGMFVGQDGKSYSLEQLIWRSKQETAQGLQPNVADVPAISAGASVSEKKDVSVAVDGSSNAAAGNAGTLAQPEVKGYASISPTADLVNEEVQVDDKHEGAKTQTSRPVTESPVKSFEAPQHRAKIKKRPAGLGTYEGKEYTPEESLSRKDQFSEERERVKEAIASGKRYQTIPDYVGSKGLGGMQNANKIREQKKRTDDGQTRMVPRIPLPPPSAFQQGAKTRTGQKKKSNIAKYLVGGGVAALSTGVAIGPLFL